MKNSKKKKKKKKNAETNEDEDAVYNMKMKNCMPELYVISYGD